MLTVNAKDADVNGNLLSLSLDVTSTQSDGRGTVTLQGPTEITAPNQKTIYAHYDGNWLSSSTISVSSPSSAVTSLTSATSTTTPAIIGCPLTLTRSGNVSYVAEVSTSRALLNEYATPTSNSAPNEGTFGSDGNLWITENNSGHLERMTQNGVRTDSKVTGAVNINYMTLAPDGNIWITEDSSNIVGKLVL